MSTFIQAGTGAVTRTIESRLRETVSVKDYGAVGDGVTNDTTAFTNALNYLASRVTSEVGGGVLYVPQGIYKLSQALALPIGVDIIGDGIVNSRLIFTGVSSHGITMIRPINASTQTWNRIERLRIQGPGAAVSTGFGVYDQGGTEWVMRDCFIHGWNCALVMDQSEIITIANCDFAACAKAGVWLVNGPDLNPAAGGSFTNRITIRECQFNGCGEYSILDDGGVDHVIRDNNYNYATKAHLRVAGATKLLVQGGEWEGAPINVILTYLTLSGNGVGQPGSICLQSNDFTQPGGTAAISVQSSCAGLTLLANGFSNMGGPAALVQGVANVAYFFTAGNIFYEHTNQGGKFLDGKAIIHNVTEAIREGAATADVGALAAGASGYVNITIQGVTPGDYVESVSAATAGGTDLGQSFEVTASVSAANTVRVRVRNIGTASADPASATYRVRIRVQSI